MDSNELKKRIALLNRHAFAAFVTALFNTDAESEGFTSFSPLMEAGEDVFCQPYLDSYGYSIHRIFLLHTPPLELFRPSCDLKINDPTLINRLVKIRNLYKGRTGQWGMVSPYLRQDDALKGIGILTNIFGIERSLYEEMLIPAYQRLKRYCGLKKPFVLIGSADSFVEKVPEKTRRVFEGVNLNHTDGLAISLSEDHIAVCDFSGERSLARGVMNSSLYPYEPVFVSEAIRQRAILHEFESLLRSDPVEEELEDFLVAHYQDIFGNKYDRIETQLWLRFPDADIAGRNRRIDVFLRNSVANDWELFEVKRLVEVSSTYRDVPVLAREVSHAIQQTKNYARILSKDKVKRHFANQGIEYYEPRLSIVVGRSPNIPHEQWRWLRAENENFINILTFDDLLAELRSRLSDRYSMIESMQSQSEITSR